MKCAWCKIYSSIDNRLIRKHFHFNCFTEIERNAKIYDTRYKLLKDIKKLEKRAVVLQRRVNDI